MIGQTLKAGRYRIERELGSGGMGVVYQAVDTQENRLVAIKMLPSTLAMDRRFVKRFLDEVRALSRLRHPNIVQLLDTFKENGNYYIVLEYIDGPTVEQLVERRPLPVRQAVDIALAVCQALSHAHSQGIIHRDIKGSNIMLTRDNVVKVTDFGIARLVTEMREEGPRRAGTLETMPPEVIQKGKADKRSDIYSLGVVLYQMLTGRLPFQAEEVAALAYQHAMTPPPRPRDFNRQVPEALEKVVLRALAKKPEDRYPTAEAFAAAIREAVSPPAAQRRPQPPQVARRRRAKPWAVVLGSVVLAAILIVATYLILQLIPGGRPGEVVKSSPTPPTETITPTQTPVLEAVPTYTPTQRPTATLSPTYTPTRAVSPTPTAPLTPTPQPSPTPTTPPIVTVLQGKIAYAVAIPPQNIYKIVLINADGSGKRELAVQGGEPSFAPDGQRLVFSVRGSGLYTMRLDGSDRRRIVADEEAAFPDWSPDGTKILFHSMRGGRGRFDIYVVDADGGHERIVTDGEQPAWAPDGRRLAYKGCIGNHCGIMLVNLDGSGKRRLTEYADDGDPSWSPDGSRIAFVSERDGNHEIYVMNSDGSDQRRLTNNGYADALPVWLPDGEHIVFRSDRDGRWAIYVMRADGSNVRKLTDAAVDPQQWGKMDTAP